MQLVVYDDELGRCLGFDKSYFSAKKYYSEAIKYALTCAHAPKFSAAPKTLYLYSDIIECERVGDSMSPLLRAMPIEGLYKDRENDETVSHTFQHVYYKRVNKSHITSIELHMADDEGKAIAFDSGVAIAVLHFRKVSL